MSEAADKLVKDADALDEVAAVADYLAGLAGDEPDKADRVKIEANVLRAWADLCRKVAESA